MFRNLTLKCVSLLSLISLMTLRAVAGPGDTVIVQTFTFGSPQSGWFVLPSDTEQFSKIYILYTLKCNPAQNPKCGEWDYLTYTYQYQQEVKPLQLNAVNYQENGISPDSFSYITSPAYQLSPRKVYHIVYDDTLSYSVSGNDPLFTQDSYPLHTSVPVSRTQYLWTAAELSQLGLSAGNLTGIQLYSAAPGVAPVNNLAIRMKLSALSSLSAQSYEASGLTTVYSSTTTLQNSGWNSIAFLTPFYWDGTSNVVMEVTYDNTASAADQLISGDQATNQVINTSGDEHSAHFNDGNYISIPSNAFASLDSQVTVAFWFKGDSFLENRTTFEAYDQYDHRVLNVHLPWSDQNVFWDAGASLVGGYDRINKQADVSDYENNWHYWAFEKNAATGEMKIFLDGSLWYSGTGKFLLMNNIKTFHIGTALWSSTVSANGNIDEFAVWNKEVDSTTLKAYMYKDLDAAHPYSSNLLVYYHFNDDDLYTVADASGNNFNGSIIGAQLPLYPANTLFRNITTANGIRPSLKFENGVYNSHIDSTVVFDTTWLAPVYLVHFADSAQPGLPTDTQLVWLPYYQYVYDAQGNIIDSNYVAADTTIHLELTPYTTDPQPTLTRWELARYITPYGINLTLGDGWTWTYDVSDYSPLLHDSVYLTAGNWQELLDMKFMFIKGAPPRKVLGIQNLWNGDYGWGTNTETDIADKKIFIPDEAKGSRVKMRITGHGEDQNNCAEFCTNTAYFQVNGQTEYQNQIWRKTCPLNPLYPQGGTWVYERANWCPGAEVQTYDWELTPFVTPGDSATLDVDLNAYGGSTSGSWANYVTESQLVTYGAPSFTRDAEVYDILSPILDSVKRRHNPICNNPLIAIRNDGSDTLTSVTITYGVVGGTPSVYDWTGSLPFMDTVQVRLGAFFSTLGNSQHFYAAVSNPNNGADENTQNDTARSFFKFPTQYPSDLSIEFKTNNNPQEDSYELTDDQGNIIWSRDNLASNTVYLDTLHLPNGCYTFRLTDTGEDGLSFWANPYQGSGYCRIRDVNTGTLKKIYGPDFGSEIYQQFTVGYFLNTEELPQTDALKVMVYPNPTTSEAWADIYLPSRGDAEVTLTNLAGETIYHDQLHDILSYGLTINLRDEPAGIYLLHIRVKDQVITKKVVLAR